MTEKGALSAPAVARSDPLSQLRRKLASGAALEVLAAGLGLALRLGSSLILTRLLVPSAFGLSAMTVTVIYGLIMLSDVGIGPAVIRSARGDDPLFLRTAYSLQVLRACMLALVASALGWPMAYLMGEPLMVQLMPCGALVLLIHGLASMRLLTLRRVLRVAPLVSLELASQCLGSAVMIAGAWAGWGVWSLVLGAVATAVVSTSLSFALPGTYRDGFAWDRTARAEIVHFGRWILASSALTFGAARGDQFVLARLLGATNLGFYNLALNISEAAEGVASRVASSVLFPLFAEVHNREPAAMRTAYYRARFFFDALAHMGLGGLFALAPWLLDLLYDDRYAPAAPMLEVLVIRAAVGLWATVCETSLIAQGLSAIGFRKNLAGTLGVLVLMPAGYWLSGVAGLLWGTVFARALSLLVLWPAARERGLFRASRELWPALCFLFGCLLGHMLELALPKL